jgi:hypothetical protein
MMSGSMNSFTGVSKKENPQYVEMEERLAREMARMKLDSQKQKIDVSRV